MISFLLSFALSAGVLSKRGCGVRMRLEDRPAYGGAEDVAQCVAPFAKGGGRCVMCGCAISHHTTIQLDAALAVLQSTQLWQASCYWLYLRDQCT